jgi:hypothetical protein
MFVDANHAGNVVTSRSHSGILIFVQNAPILFYSKRHNSVETSTFGCEFCALRIGEEMIEGLRYKLQMFGVPIGVLAKVLCDNEGVAKNTSIPESVLITTRCAMRLRRQLLKLRRRMSKQIWLICLQRSLRVSSASCF